MTIRGLVFDLDGLILDTEGPELRSWEEEFGLHGVELSFEAWHVGIGTVGAFDPYDHLEALLGAPVDRDAIRARRHERFSELMRAERLLPGVRRLLEAGAVARLSLGLASSSTREWVEGFLRAHGIADEFDAIRASEDVAEVKPAPDLYLRVLADLGLEPSEAIAFEDSPNGVRAAKAAGLFCVAVPNAITGRLSIDGADVVVTSLEQVTLADLCQRADGGRASRG